MRAVRSARRHIVMVKIRLLDLKKFLSPKAPAHILWLKCTGVLSLMPSRKAAQLWGNVGPRLAQITVGIIPIVIADSKLRAESDGFVVFTCGSFNLALLVKCKARQHRRVCPFPCKPRTRKKMTVQSTNMRGGVRD